MDKFLLLEEKLDKIVEGYAQLKEEREELSVKIKKKDEEVERLKNEISSLNKERVEVGTKIERLIERLEEFPLEEQ
jgi:chromosome segregation ATPase